MPAGWCLPSKAGVQAWPWPLLKGPGEVSTNHGFPAEGVSGCPGPTGRAIGFQAPLALVTGTHNRTGLLRCRRLSSQPRALCGSPRWLLTCAPVSLTDTAVGESCPPKRHSDVENNVPQSPLSVRRGGRTSSRNIRSMLLNCSKIFRHTTSRVLVLGQVTWRTPQGPQAAALSESASKCREVGNWKREGQPIRRRGPPTAANQESPAWRPRPQPLAPPHAPPLLSVSQAWALPVPSSRLWRFRFRSLDLGACLES